MSEITIGLVQTRSLGDPAANLKHTLGQIEAAADRGATIVSTQELFTTDYFCQVEDHALFGLAESIPGPTTGALQKVAKARSLVIVGSLFERRAPGLYHNTAVVIDSDGALLGKYRKMHIPDDPGFYEKFYFTPGDLGFRTFDVTLRGASEKLRIAPLVCWDQWYPEGARLAALAGAQILFYPTAIGANLGAEPEGLPETQRDAWETIQRSHAIANGVFVAATNRVGKEGDLTFWGNSFVSGPFGQVLAKGSHGFQAKEDIVIAKLDLAMIERTRQGWPFLRDRRIDAYAPLTQRYLDG